MNGKKSKLNRLLAVLLGCLMVLALTSCGSGSGSGSSSASEAKKDSGELKEMDVVLDWYPNAVHSFIYYAMEKGYFKDEGLKVKVIPPAESVDAINFVASGKAQVGVSYPIDTINAYVNQKMPVRAIGAISQKSLGVMCSLKGGPVKKDMSSLKGHKIGYSGTGASKAEVGEVMKDAGLTSKDYELVNVGFDLVTALTTKKVDLIAGPLINDEVITMKNAGYDVDVWNYSDYGLPEFYGLIFVVDNKAYEKDSESYQAFLRACRKGFQDMKSDEDGTLKLIMDKMSSEDNPLDEKQQKGSYETLIPRMEPKDGEFLTMSEDRWQSYIDWMYQTKQIKEKCKPSDLMTPPEFK